MTPPPVQSITCSALPLSLMVRYATRIALVGMVAGLGTATISTFAMGINPEGALLAKANQMRQANQSMGAPVQIAQASALDLAPPFSAESAHSPALLMAQAPMAQAPSVQKNQSSKKPPLAKPQKPAMPLSVVPKASDPSSFSVADIRLEGLVDIEPATVFTYLPIKVGETVNDEKIQAAIQNLYGTRLFDSVTMRRESAKAGEVLVVQLQERAIIGELSINGAYEFEADKLKESLRGVGLSEGKLLDPVLLHLAEQEIKKQYIARGYYGARVRYATEAVDARRLKVVFTIDEGKVALIDKITIYGNKALSQSEIRDQMDSTDSAFFKSARQYSRQKLDADLERIRTHYQNQGYMDFRIDTAQVSITPDLSNIHITIGVSEGALYTIRGVELANPSEVLSNEDFAKMNTIREGETYSQENINKVNRAIYAHLAQQGFAQARANVSRIKSSNNDERTVLLRFEALTSQRMMVRSINIIGNTRTSDEVIRREFRLHEGELFDSTLVDKSRQRVERLDFFSEVNVAVTPVENTTDLVDLDTKVTEKRTGNFQFGISSSNVDKIGFNASIQQNNWLGTGKSVSLSFNTAKASRSLNANYFDPYITHWGLGLGLNAYSTLDDSSSLSTGRYIVRSEGFGGRLVYPLDDDSSLAFGLRAGRDSYTLYSDSPTTYVDFVSKFTNRPTDITASLQYAVDKRDSTIYPMKGAYFRVSHERTLSMSKLQYGRSFAAFQYYFPLSERIAAFFNTDVGKVSAIGGREIPFTKMLYMGGIGSVRGFEYGTLGPYDTRTARYTGGDRSFNANFELLLPFPGSSQRSREARLALFADTGMVWGQGESRSSRQLRSSIGVALSWYSPIGPLRFSFARPTKTEPGDKIEKFQFQVGTSF